MTRVSYAKNKRGKPVGLFTNGELDWHSDQQASYAAQRVIGLSSLLGTRNSQTTFLCTAPVYDALNCEDKTMFDELISVWEWDGGSMSEEIIPSQLDIVRANMVPVDGMECPLIDQTASGRKGFKFPSHCFKRFRDVSVDESIKIKTHIWSKLNNPKNIYTQNWEDGQTVFMDQNITLHARPTNVKDGGARTMARMVSFMEKLFPNQVLNGDVMFNGQEISRADFAILVDESRKKQFIKETGIVV